MAASSRRSPWFRVFFLVSIISLSIITIRISTKAENTTTDLTSVPYWLTSYLMPEQKVSKTWDPDAHRYRPQVAFNYIQNEYLVVWHNTWANGDRYVYARRLDIHGKPIGNVFALTNILTDQVHPFVVYNGTDEVYFLVWMYDVSGNNTRYEIWGSIIPWNATGYGGVFRIGYSTDPLLDMWYPSVAWNSLHNEYLVIWDNYLDGKTNPQSIGYRRVAADGTPGTSGMITSGFGPIESDLVYNAVNDQYLVVWARKYDDIGNNRHIYGARLYWDAVIIETDRLIYGLCNDHRNPAVAVDSQRYALAFECWPSTWPTSLAYVMLFDFSLNNLFSDYEFSFNFDLLNPDVAAKRDAGEYLFVWEEGKSYGQTIQGYRFRYPQVYASIKFRIEEEWWYKRVPAVAGDGPGYLITYTGRSDDPEGWQHIYATKVWQAGIFMPLTIR